MGSLPNGGGSECRRWPLGAWAAAAVLEYFQVHLASSGHPRCVSHEANTGQERMKNGAVWWVECQYVYVNPGVCYGMELEPPSLCSSKCPMLQSQLTFELAIP